MLLLRQNNVMMEILQTMTVVIQPVKQKAVGIVTLQELKVAVIEVSLIHNLIVCGNGVINAGEACDDGNLIDGDGCTNCTIDSGYVCSGTFCTKLCGNGVINAGNGEVCDDGNTIDYDGCTNC